MNMQSDGSLQCGSSSVGDAFLEDDGAVGFDGRLTDDDAPAGCATSFATPRVAWLLAAYEVQRQVVPAPGAWAVDVVNRLKKIRAEKAGVSALWLDPASLMGSQ
jgi:hypothetical protein